MPKLKAKKVSNKIIFYDKQGTKAILGKKHFLYDESLKTSKALKKLKENFAIGIAAYAVPAGMLRKRFPVEKLKGDYKTYSMPNIKALSESKLDPLKNRIIKKALKLKGKTKIEKAKKAMDIFSSKGASFLVKELNKQKPLTETISNDKFMTLLLEDDPDLLEKSLKSLLSKAQVDDIVYFSKYPEKLYNYVLQQVRKEKLDEARFKELYKKYKTELKEELKKRLTPAESLWKKYMVDSQISIISCFLAYKTLKTKLDENTIVSELVKDINPYDFNIVQHTIVNYIEIAKTIGKTALGLSGLAALVLLGLRIYRKNKNKGNQE